MKTFENISKGEFVNEQQKHFDQDQILQGTYGDTGDEFKGCWMGCAANSLARSKGIMISTSDHKVIAENIYGSESCEWLVRLNEKIFEYLPTKDSSQWVLDSAKATPEGVDHAVINSLEVPIKIWILEFTKSTHKNKQVHKVTDLVIAALKSGSEEDLEKARKAAADAAAAAYAAAADAAAAAYAAADAAAAYAAAYAAARIKTLSKCADIVRIDYPNVDELFS